LTALDPAPDLVLAMSREHLSTLVELDGRLLARTFTLREFVRLAALEGPRLPGEKIGHYVERVRRGRSGSILVAGLADDVIDPMGRRRPAYEVCAREIDDLVAIVSAHLYPERGAIGAEGQN
jgi:protein-tyrosine phosphatase